MLPLPSPFNEMSCDICGTKGDLKVIKQLLSDPPQPCEWRCLSCIKVVDNAQEQKRYLKMLNRIVTYLKKLGL